MEDIAVFLEYLDDMVIPVTIEDESKKNILFFIAGFICYSLSKTIKCQDCKIYYLVKSKNQIYSVLLIEILSRNI
uniref:Uncharacterized protein n=1 Tax=Lepeophtheirus salmonis TaxID=72036 RepID=A0A0K2UIB6_LEPSM